MPFWGPIQVLGCPKRLIGSFNTVIHSISDPCRISVENFFPGDIPG